MTARSPVPRAKFPQPLDRLAIAVIIVLGVLIGGLLLLGDRTAPRVRDFTWQNKQIGSEDTAFVLTFNRPMNHATVEKNLQITPPLPGKMSWAGRRMAYTLSLPAPYGTQFQVNLQGATDIFGANDGLRRSEMTPFSSSFATRDRVFLYIGTQGEEDGRLVMYNLTQQQQTILTPPELVVMDYKPYPLGDRVLVSATVRSPQAQGVLDQQLYTVTTGIHVNPAKQLEADADAVSQIPPTSAGKVELVLDNREYQNLRFDLSANGKIIIAQRVSRSDPADFGPWLLREGQPPQPLKGQPGGEFLITPDSDTLAIAQGQGLAILPLEPDAQPLDFLPKFGMVLSFSQDGSLAAMLKFNGDRTRSLFLVSNQGTQKELLKNKGSILRAQFDPTKQWLYCVLTELVEGEVYREDPYLAVIDLKTSKLTKLTNLTDRDTLASLSPDGLAVLYDQTVASVPTPETSYRPRNSEGKVIADSRLWLLPIDPEQKTKPAPPESIPLAGLRPRWLP